MAAMLRHTLRAAPQAPHCAARALPATLMATLLALAAAGCGQKGPLTLPSAAATAAAAVSPAAPAMPASAASAPTPR
jgi:predicted small lipoprotein YifL